MLTGDGMPGFPDPTRVLSVHRCLAAVAALLTAAAAHASPMETFGFGPRHMAMGNASTALAEDYAAGFFNPAGAAFVEDVVFGIGYLHGFTRLRLNGVSNDTQDAGGTSFGLVVPTMIYKPMGLRLSFVQDLYLPDREILRVRILPASRPYFFMYDNRVHRVATDIALALGIPGLAVGGGITILADTSGRGVYFEIGTDLASYSEATAELEQSFPVRVAPIAGMMYAPWDWLRFGLSYRAPIQASVSVNTLSKIVALYVENGAAVIGVKNTTYYSPPKISIGVACDPLDDLTLSTDLSINLWSRQPDPSADIQILLDLQRLNPTIIQNEIEPVRFDDTVTNRFGAEYRLHPVAGMTLALRAGYVYEPTPVPPQTGATNLMDSDKHIFSLGLGIEIESAGEVLTKPLSVDAFGQFHVLERKLVTKNDLASPVPPYWFDGTIYAVGLSGTLKF